MDILSVHMWELLDAYRTHLYNQTILPTYIQYTEHTVLSVLISIDYMFRTQSLDLGSCTYLSVIALFAVIVI